MTAILRLLVLAVVLAPAGAGPDDCHARRECCAYKGNPAQCVPCRPTRQVLAP